jgi:hypothetical protein
MTKPPRARHRHRFVEEHEGFVGFGWSRASDEDTLIIYLQKIADDDLARTLVGRMSDEDLDDLGQRLGRLLQRLLSEDEYHRLFLKT